MPDLIHSSNKNKQLHSEGIFLNLLRNNCVFHVRKASVELFDSTASLVQTGTLTCACTSTHVMYSFAHLGWADCYVGCSTAPVTYFCSPTERSCTRHCPCIWKLCGKCCCELNSFHVGALVQIYNLLPLAICCPNNHDLLSTSTFEET